MRVAFVHDWLNGMRGGERVLETLLEDHPGAPIHTLIHEAARVSPAINAHPIHTSRLQKSAWMRRRYRWLLPYLTRVVTDLKPQDVDLVVSLSHCVAKGATIPNGVPHLCHCFTPMRYIWDLSDHYVGNHARGWWMRPALAALRPSLRRWDVETAQRVTEFVSISEHVADKIRRFYGRESRVIYPPVNTDLFTADTILPLDQYLVVSALVPYKRVDLAVRAAIEGRFRLRIVGEGPEWLSLQRLSRRHDNIEMLGWLPDHELVQEYRDARAIIFPGEEDFGIVPVEAQACGRPVLALRAGGALETVVENETGLFFEQQTTEAIIDAVRRFEAREWKPAVCRANAERFHPARFRREMREVMEALVSKGSAAPAR